jgi:ferrous iron transport protein B
MLLGVTVASLVFTLGRALNLSGLQAMFAFYGLALAFTLFMGLFRSQQNHT